MPENVDSTDKCYLTYNEDGYLICTYNHKSGEKCLGNICQFCNKLNCICYEEQDTCKGGLCTCTDDQGNPVRCYKDK